MKDYKNSAAAAANDGRNCWNTAREKERRKARFEIRERVSVGCSSIIRPTPSDVVYRDKNSFGEELERIIVQINCGDRSAFSLSLLAKQFQLLSTLVPSEFILQGFPEQQMISWFGTDRLQFLKGYVNSLDAISLMEYSTLLGRYHILGAFILGGINPCSRGPPRKGSCQNLRFDQELHKVGDQVLKLFFDRFPLALSAYIFKRAVDMRLASYSEERSLDHHNTQQEVFICGVCQESIPQRYRLLFTEPEKSSCSCHHALCELCFWKDILKHVNYRWGDVVVCPCCNQAPHADKAAVVQNGLSGHRNSETPQIRAQRSKTKFELLPPDPRALKHSKRKKKRAPEAQAIAKTWSQAVLPSLGMCQSVRHDKFIKHTDAGAIPYVRGCLDAGVDVDALNEYGQTTLYIAAWRGDLDLVELLLSYGADPRLKANGRLSIESVCRAHGHCEILRLIQDYCTKFWANKAKENTNTDVSVDNEHCYGAYLEERIVDNSDQSIICLDTLIGPKEDHPGAGSYVISGCIAHVGPLVKLRKSLPIDQSSPKTQKKQEICSDRSYFCDAEGWLREIIRKQILLASSCDAKANGCEGDKPEVLVLPHMRFLHYIRAGSFLAPHVDLNRVDPISGRRSTHSFLLYLSDCEHGGETVLLEDIANPNVLSEVKPKSGRLLLFPHACPHKGEVVEDVPKLLIRGEVYLDLGGK